MLQIHISNNQSAFGKYDWGTKQKIIISSLEKKYSCWVSLLLVPLEKGVWAGGREMTGSVSQWRGAQSSLPYEEGSNSLGTGYVEVGI